MASRIFVRVGRKMPSPFEAPVPYDLVFSEMGARIKRSGTFRVHYFPAAIELRPAGYDTMEWSGMSSASMASVTRGIQKDKI